MAYGIIIIIIYSISIVPLQVTLYSEALPTTVRTLCWSFHAETQRAVVSEGLAQGPYGAPRAGFEPTMLRPQANARTNCTTLPHQIHSFSNSLQIIISMGHEM